MFVEMWRPEAKVSAFLNHSAPFPFQLHSCYLVGGVVWSGVVWCGVCVHMCHCLSVEVRGHRAGSTSLLPYRSQDVALSMCVCVCVHACAHV